MENLFNFSYQEAKIQNLDGTDSRYGIVYGQHGNVIHTKKDSYNIIKTEDITNFGEAFMERGHKVTSFVHKHGEVIGLNIDFGQEMSKVGDKTIRAYINIPNNGGGCGYLSLKEVRLICTNGMVRTINGANGTIRIPHTLNYDASLKLMQESLEKFSILLKMSRDKDLLMDSRKMDRLEVVKLLNQWFYNHEMPLNHKDGISEIDFRRILVEDPESIKCIDRYNQLMDAFKKELSYNEQLNLDLSAYTVYATLTNYITRRVETSKSSAPIEVMEQRAYTKVESFEKVIL